MEFKKYLEYLETIKENLSINIYEFAKDENRHNLSSPHSLRDAWISSITIKENRNKERPFNPKSSIIIELLGPKHDRNIILSYTEVESYEIKGHRNQFNWGDTFHGDIDRHEIRLTESLYEHIIWFHSDSILRIKFRAFEIEEKMYNRVDGPDS